MKSVTSRIILISSIVIIVFFIVYINFYRNITVNYQGREYVIRDDVYGLMLFNENNGGEFKLNSIYSNDSVVLMQLYEYQNKRFIWVHYNNSELFLVDSLIFNFDNFNRIRYDDVNFNHR